ncbi:MAG: sialidase family protein [Kofleriaceae bacterium]
MAPPRRLLIVAALAVLGAELGGATPAAANGRPPSAVSVAHRDERHEVLLATTFGVLLSRDDGCSFRWLCEQSIGFGGTFDPKYAIGVDGTIYATTFEGLRVSRDGGCTFSTATAGTPPDDPGALAGIWVDAIDLSPEGDVWIATAESGRYNDVYRSRDQGRTFAPMGLHSEAIWWKSVKISRKDPARIYVTGYQIAGAAPDGGQLPPTAHLRRSRDGGATWEEGSLAGVTMAATPVVHVVELDPRNAEVLFLRSANAVPPAGDKLYRSFDGGATFREVLSLRDAIHGVVMRGNTVVVAAGLEGAYESTDGGVTFAPIADAPHLTCLSDLGDGTLLGCGANWEPDFFALGRSSDAHDWRKVTRFSDMVGPLSCPAGTAQHDTCEISLWPSLREQFGASGDTTCPAVPNPPAPPPAQTTRQGCCDGSGGGAGGGLAGGLALLVLSIWRRRPTAAAARS